MAQEALQTLGPGSAGCSDLTSVSGTRRPGLAGLPVGILADLLQLGQLVSGTHSWESVGCERSSV